MRIIFSKNRPAQLDLLFQSLELNTNPETTHIIWYAENSDFKHGYEQIVSDPMTPADEFNNVLRRALVSCTDETVSFFCDDDIVYRKLSNDPATVLLSNDSILTVCLYLGQGNVKQPLPDGFPLWEWGPLPRHDFGYPCGIDGNTYRVADFLRLIGSDGINNPTFLESVLSMRIRIFAEQRPLMTCFIDQCLVGVPVNRVSESSGVPYGRTFPYTTEELNIRFLAGDRINLTELDFSSVNSCHHELQFVWRGV